MKKLMKLFLALAVAGLYLQSPGVAEAKSKKKYAVAWSHYTGWEPWAYAEHSGILEKWAKKYGIKISITLVNDYVESINLYTSGKFDACTMTNMDALTIPAVGGVDSTALIVGDFSNGNDGIVVRQGSKVRDLKGRTVKLVQFSVSHYLLSRALAMNKMREKDIKLVNTSLFAKDWYIDQQKRKTYEADPIPSQLTHEDYKEGSLDVAYHYPYPFPQFQDSIVLNQSMHLLKELR